MTLRVSHMGLSRKDPIALERFYTKYFGFERACLAGWGRPDCDDKVRGLLHRVVQGGRRCSCSTGRGRWSALSRLAPSGIHRP